MAKKKRVTRKELLKKPDEFLTFSAKAIGFVANHQKPLLGVMIGVVVVALAFGGYRYFSNLSEQKASALFEEGRSLYLAEITGDKTAPAEEKAAGQFEKVLREYPSTKTARFARLVYADMSYHRGDYQRAVELYQEALSAFAGEGAVQKLIWQGLAYTYEAQKDYNAAAEYFQRITETEDDFIKADACYNLGRIMEVLHHQDKALEAYNKLVENYPDSVGFQIAKEKVFRLKGAPVGSQ